jgi:hypothetical protein
VVNQGSLNQCIALFNLPHVFKDSDCIDEERNVIAVDANGFVIDVGCLAEATDVAQRFGHRMHMGTLVRGEGNRLAIRGQCSVVFTALPEQAGEVAVEFRIVTCLTEGSADNLDRFVTRSMCL